MNVATGSISTPAKSQEMQKLALQSVDADLRRDSGYFTQSQTPDRNSSQHSSRSSSNAVNRIATQTRLLSSGGAAYSNLSEFDVTVDDITLSRFTHIQSQIEKPLLKYVHRTPGKYRAMAIRLMVLGTSRVEAKPHIVVLASEDQCKRLRKFFDKSSVQSLCQPGDVTIPAFEVLIYARPPEPKQSDGDDDIDVLIPLIGGHLGFTPDTFCGAPIIIRHPSGIEKRATFGGVIKVIDHNGEFKLYGLTAGHVVGDLDDLSIDSDSDMVPGCDDLFLSDSELGSDSDSDSNSNLDTDQLNETAQEASQDYSVSGDPERVLILQDSSVAWSSLELGDIGVISKESPQSPGACGNKMKDTQAYFDWALIELSKYKPNRLSPRVPDTNDNSEPVVTTSGDLAMPPPAPTYKGVKKSVVVISGSEGPKRGTMSALPSRLLMGPGRIFVNTLVVNLDMGKKIVDGDSGSWVVNERTLEVYGYVVAADAFGGGYIMPLDATFGDIVSRLRVKSVELASLVDMASVVMDKMTLTTLEVESEEEIVQHPDPPASSTVNQSGSTSIYRKATVVDDPETTYDKDRVRVDSGSDINDTDADWVYCRDEDRSSRRRDRSRGTAFDFNFPRERRNYDDYDNFDHSDRLLRRSRYDDGDIHRRDQSISSNAAAEMITLQREKGLSTSGHAGSGSEATARGQSLDRLNERIRDARHRELGRTLALLNGVGSLNLDRDGTEKAQRSEPMYDDGDEERRRWSRRRDYSRPKDATRPVSPGRRVLNHDTRNYYTNPRSPPNVSDSGYGSPRGSARSSGGDIGDLGLGNQRRDRDSGYGTARSSPRGSGGNIADLRHGRDSGYGTGRSSAVHSARSSAAGSTSSMGNTPQYDTHPRLEELYLELYHD